MNDGSRQIGCILLAVSGEDRGTPGKGNEKIEDRLYGRTIYDRFRYGLRNRMMKHAGLHASQHLAEGAMQSAQLALEGGMTLLLLVVRRRAFMRVPRGVQERTLLRDKQQKNAEEERKTTLAHATAYRFA
jgi:hypothetical protein